MTHMSKLASFFLVIFCWVTLAIPTLAQPITFDNQKVVYDLPSPGLLPDHPLYFIKAIRDRLTEFATNDPLKKVELYLSYSDKRAQMALDLSKKGKNSLAISTISKGEKYFMKIPGILREAEKQNVKATDEFKYNLTLSNLKHREVIETLLKELPQGENEALTQVLELNKAISMDLERL